jgi:hypothetical protein
VDLAIRLEAKFWTAVFLTFHKIFSLTKLYICVCMYVCLCVYIYISIYIYIYILKFYTSRPNDFSAKRSEVKAGNVIDIGYSVTVTSFLS